MTVLNIVCVCVCVCVWRLSEPDEMSSKPCATYLKSVLILSFIYTSDFKVVPILIFLGTFAKLLKATVNFGMSVRSSVNPSAC
jgi:hypothetical protein